jgi:hypothetical protein
MAFFQRTDGSGVLLLAPGDNIAVATAELPAGAQREIDRQKIVLKAKVESATNSQSDPSRPEAASSSTARPSAWLPATSTRVNISTRTT